MRATVATSSPWTTSQPSPVVACTVGADVPMPAAGAAAPTAADAYVGVWHRCVSNGVAGPAAPSPRWLPAGRGGAASCSAAPHAR